MARKPAARGKSKRQLLPKIKAAGKLLSKNMRDRRAELHLTQEELAEKANVHRSYVGKVERNEHNPNLSSLVALADALDISISQLFQAPAEKPPESSKTGPKRR